jgi:hypothetical protein
LDYQQNDRPTEIWIIETKEFAGLLEGKSLPEHLRTDKPPATPLGP